MSKGKIMVVEDDLTLSAGLCFELDMNGYLTMAAYNVKKARMLAEREQLDLAVLDVNLPDGNGFDLCRKIKDLHPELPVIFLTARDLEDEVVAGFDMGADDYITKPFGVMELISRVKALLRRSMNMEEEKFLSTGDIFLDGEKHMVYVKDEPCDLTFKEYELLKLLIQNQGIVMSRDVIMERIWGINFEGESRTLDVHIKTLRQKLKSAGSLIKTVRNVGYMIE